METERSTIWFGSSSQGEITARYLAISTLSWLTGIEVIIVGTGIPGIATSTSIPQKVAHLTYKVFEKQDRREYWILIDGHQISWSDLMASKGGTWAQNCYPGVRCDIPSYSYRKDSLTSFCSRTMFDFLWQNCNLVELTFVPNTHWSEYYSSGAEIQQYYERLVKDFGVEEHLNFKHEVLSAIWSGDVKQWIVKV